MQLSAALFLAGWNSKLAGGTERATYVYHEIIAFPEYYLLSIVIRFQLNQLNVQTNYFCFGINFTFIKQSFFFVIKERCDTNMTLRIGGNLSIHFSHSVFSYHLCIIFVASCGNIYFRISLMFIVLYEKLRSVILETTQLGVSTYLARKQ